MAPDVSGGTQRTVYFPENEFSRPRNFSQPTLFSIGDGVNRRDHHNVRRVSLDSNEQHTQVGVNASSSTSHPNPPLVPTRQLKPSLSLPENRQKNDQTGEFPLPAQKCVLLPDTSEREGVSSSRSESHSALKDVSMQGAYIVRLHLCNFPFFIVGIKLVKVDSLNLFKFHRSRMMISPPIIRARLSKDNYP